MAVSTSNAFSGPYTANGSTTTFPFTFVVLATTDVAVILRDADGVDAVVDTADYTVSLTGSVPSAGSVVFGTAPASGNEVFVYLDPAFEQQTTFADGSAWKAAAVNNVNDRAALRDQALKRDSDRAIKVPIDEQALPMASLADADGKVLGVVSGVITPIENSVVAAADYAADAMDAADSAGTAQSAAEEARDEALAAQAAAETASANSNASVVAAQQYFPGARSYVPQGAVTGAATISTAGTGGTNGTFDLAWSGGNFAVNPTGTFTVSGGAVTAITITGAGLYIGNALSKPTMSFAASAGLTGAAGAFNTAYLKTAGEYWLTDTSPASAYLALFQNQANAAVEIDAQFDPMSAGAAGAARDEAVTTVATVKRDMFDGVYTTSDLSLGSTLVANATGAFGSNFYRVNGYAFVEDGIYDTLTIQLYTTSSVIAYVYHRNGTSMEPFDSIDFGSMSAGTYTLAPDLVVPQGYYVGFYAPGVGFKSSQWANGVFIGGSETFTAASVTTTGSQAVASFGCRLKSGFAVDELSDEINANKKAAFEDVSILDAVVAGASSITSPTGTVTANYRVAVNTFPNGGWLDSVSIEMGAAGSPVVYVYSKTGNDFAPVTAVTLGALTTGTHSNVPVDVYIPPDHYVGAYVQGVASKSGQWSGGVYTGSTSSFTSSAPTTAGVAALIQFNCRAASLSGMGDMKAYVDDTVGGDSGGASTSLIAVPAVLYMGGWGQSNEAGENDVTVTSRQEFGALAFANGGTTLYPLKPDAGTIGTKVFTGYGCAAQLRRRMMAEGYPAQRSNRAIVMGWAGLGGTAIDDLDKGTTIYQYGQDQLAAAKAQADADGVPFVHLGQRAFQGERDAIIATPYATYYSKFVQMALDYDTDSKLVAPGANDRLTVCVQVTSATSYASSIADAWAIMTAVADAERDSNLISIACPGYVGNSWADDRHAADDGSYIMGAYMAEAAFLYGTTGARFEALRVVDQYISGNNIVLVYNRPDLVKDTTTIPAITNSGFSVVNGSDVAQTISSVTVSGETVTLAMASTPATGWKIRYARNTTGGAMTPYFGAAGNIRDSAGTNKPTVRGWTMHNWAIAQEITL